MMPDAQRAAYNRMAVRITELECMMRDAIAALYDAEMTETADELSERLKEEGAFDHRPDWHRRPTCPGRWLTRDGDFETSAKWKQDDIDYCERVGYHHRLYYGPISDPPEEVR